MNDTSKSFLNKIKIDSYIYTFTFMAAAVLYIVRFSAGTEAVMLLIASFAFYTIGRQVSLVPKLEAGEKVDTQPKAPLWVRGISYFVVMMIVLALMFALIRH